MILPLMFPYVSSILISCDFDEFPLLEIDIFFKDEVQGIVEVSDTVSALEANSSAVPVVTLSGVNRNSLDVVLGMLALTLVHRRS